MASLIRSSIYRCHVFGCFVPACGRRLFLGHCLCWLLLFCRSAQTAFDCRSGCVSNRQALHPMSALTLSFQVFLLVMHEESVYVQFHLQIEVLISAKGWHNSQHFGDAKSCVWCAIQYWVSLHVRCSMCVQALSMTSLPSFNGNCTKETDIFTCSLMSS